MYLHLNLEYPKMPPFMQYLSGHDVAMIEINGWTQVISNNILLILSETFSENERGSKQVNKSHTIENECDQST